MNILDRRIQPAPGIIHNLKFPVYFEAVLNNGITVIVVTDKKYPVVSTKFVYKTGSAYDINFGKDKFGVASFTSMLLMKGTPKYNAERIAEKFDRYGAGFSAGCDSDMSYIQGYCLKKYFNEIFAFVTELVAESDFPDDEIKRMKQLVRNDLSSYLDEGDILSRMLFKEIVYKGSPYSYSSNGYVNSVTKIKREYIEKFAGVNYTASNLLIGFVGDITPEEAISLVDQNPGKLNPENIPRGSEVNGFADGFSDTLPGVYVIDRKDAVQSDISVGHISIKRNNPDFLKLSVLNTLLGGYFTSRINKNLREKNGFTYGARSYLNWKKFSGDFSVETSVKNDLTSDAIKEIRKELNEIRRNGITGEELKDVKAYLTGSYPMQLETSNSIATKILNLKMYDVEKNYYENYISNINSLTIDEMNETASKYIHPDNLLITVAGRADDISESLKELGNVNLVKDTDVIKINSEKKSNNIYAE